MKDRALFIGSYNSYLLKSFANSFYMLILTQSFLFVLRWQRFAPFVLCGLAGHTDSSFDFSITLTATLFLLKTCCGNYEETT